MADTLVLSLSTDYVSHWGVQEALRELLQNMVDAERDDHPGFVEERGADLIIGSERAVLPRATLLLGETTKAEHSTSKYVGKFGEGYKLAALVLCREGRRFAVRTGTERWEFYLQDSPAYGREALHVDIEGGLANSVCLEFEVDGVGLAEVEAVYQPELPQNTPLEDRPGEVWVEGLRVCTVDKFRYGYNFTSERLSLDRDRRMVREFDLSWQTSRVWRDTRRGEDVRRLLEEDAPDVAHLDSWAERDRGQDGNVITHVVSGFLAEFGRGCVPVTEQEEIQKAQAAGMQWKLVPRQLRNLLWRAVGYFIPSVGTPAQRLRKWLGDHQHALSQEARLELKDILRQLEGAGGEETKRHDRAGD